MTKREARFTAMGGEKKPPKRLGHHMTPRRRRPDGFSSIRVITADAEYSIKPSEVPPRPKRRPRILPKVHPLPSNATGGTFRAL